MRRWIGAWVYHRKALLKFVDQGSILLVVYTAFSEAVNEGLWRDTPVPALLGLVLCCIVLLALSLLGCVALGRIFKFNLEDRSEEHTSELQSLMRISYAVFCLKKKIT